MSFFIKNPNKSIIAKNIFKTEEYLKSIEDERKTFMTQFVNTQNFATFIEMSHEAKGKSNEISYFLYGAELLKSSGKSILESYWNSKLDQAIHAHDNVRFNNYIAIHLFFR